MRRKCYYEKVNKRMPAFDDCHDACEDCKYFLTGEETKSITININGLSVFDDINNLVETIENIYNVRIDFIEERMN